MNEINANNLVRIDPTANRPGRTPTVASTPAAPAAQPPADTAQAKPNGKTETASSQRATPSNDALAARVREINQRLRSGGTQLRFSMTADFSRTIIQVIDKQTEEVIRQIPPQEVLALAEHLAQFNRLQSLGLQEQI